MGCGVEGEKEAAVREGVDRCFGGRGGLERGVGELTGVVVAGGQREVEVGVEVQERSAGMHEARGGARRTVVTLGRGQWQSKVRSR